MLNLHLVDGSSEVLLQFAVIQRPQDGIDVGRDGVIQLHLISPEDREDRDPNGRIWDSNGPLSGLKTISYKATIPSCHHHFWWYKLTIPHFGGKHDIVFTHISCFSVAVL